MPRNGRDRIWMGLTVLLGFAMCGFGCQSSRPVLSRSGSGSPAYTAYGSGTIQPGPAATVLSQRSRVAWSITTGQGPSPQTMKGEDSIASDGTLALGPYGSVAVAGQTVDQARKTIERHVAHYVSDPRVTLQRVIENNKVAAIPVEPSGSTGNDGWRPAASAAADSRTTSVVGAQFLSPVPMSEPAASLGPVRGTQRAQAGSEWKAEAAPPEELPQPRATSDTSRLHPEPAASVTTLGVGGQAPHELAKATLPPYVIEPPDILLVEAKPEAVLDQPIAGQHLVRPDGTISLGYKGSVFVSGMTLDQAREAVYQHLKDRGVDVKPDKVNVDVIAYNSKVYYVITDGAGYGEQVVRVPVTGNETVLDAIGQINGLPPVSSKRCIWVARRAPGDGGAQQVLPVDWIGITERGLTVSNYQLLPGDRLYVHSDKWLRFNNAIDKRIAPFERMLGATLLGSQTVNSIRNRTGTGTGTTIP